MNEQLGGWFIRSEFACKCGCGFDTIDSRTLKILNDVRTYFDAPVIVHSAARCERYNTQIGGSARSQHIVGRAADFHVKGVSLLEVYEYLSDQMEGWGGLGFYPRSGFIHVDSRTTGPARWKEK